MRPSKATAETPAELVPPSTPEGGSIVQPVATGGAPAEAAVPAPNIQQQENNLRQRIAEQEQAERIQREAYQAQMRANLDVAGPNDEKPQPKLSQKDLEWLGQRPGVEHDPEFLTMVQNTPGYGTDRFYQILSVAFPAERYRRIEPQPQPQPAPALATEKRPQDMTDEDIIREAARINGERNANQYLYSAPPSRDIPSAATGRPVARITLSHAEREMARLLGQDEVTYAKNKARMLEEKRRGMHPDS
jgi:hypothetical protein